MVPSLSSEARDLLARALRYEELDGALDLCRKGGVAGDEIAGGERIVLCLSHEIGCNHGRLGVGIGEHADLGWTGDDIDSHIARDELLGRGHVGITGTSDDIDLFDALGAVGERGDGLGASHGIDLVHTCDARCSERLGRDAPGLAHLRVVLRGVTMTMRPTPATLAGMMFMSTVEGYCARPPGT